MISSEQVSPPAAPLKEEVTIADPAKEANRSLITAIGMLSLWATSLACLLSLDISAWPLLWKLPLMVWQMFLYTGLFIVAHDAMHGAVYPKNSKINDGMGAIALACYALFSFEKLKQKHWQHHQHPVSERDPDSHNGKHQNFFAWYFQFMKSHWSWVRILALVALFHTIRLTLALPAENMTLFWVIPSISSSAQLFFFGTYLPHREPEGGYKNHHRAQSNPLPVFWSFITCYHFGYHEEHHEYPQLAWWQLPGAAKAQGTI
ncbi:fatty acid desaturase [Trichocoleus sp. FACHB-591]|uniref:beta-carotene ketolase CrtW n=1 Tax=Trichocoleus sp. FACHB-591 TaxID=2692872 RepID=UPI0016878B6A|nr:fatty acid desaturase [Trichocoleus sp. FACHB-591]MBD2098342.1 fatty acid desaturase [Trichocoleus sp. FACHB-591]